MKLRQFLQIVGLVFFLVFMWFVAQTRGFDQSHTAMPTELHFYQIEPVCDNKVPAYIVLMGKLYISEMHKVWVCGYRR